MVAVFSVRRTFDPKDLRSASPTSPNFLRDKVKTCFQPLLAVVLVSNLLVDMVFGASLVSIFIGIIYATREITISYAAILLEIEFWRKEMKY